MNEQEIFSRLSLAVRQGGVIARDFQGRVTNDGKELSITIEGEDERTRAMRTAKTLVDEVVQEVILLAAADCLDPKQVSIDAEEKTPSLSLFPEPNAATSLVIDPVDGSLEYIEDKTDFSVCVGLVSGGTVMMSIVYYPPEDIAYVLSPERKPLIIEHFGTPAAALAKEVVIPQTGARAIYADRRVPGDVTDRFAAAGFEIITPGENPRSYCYANRLLEVLYGRAAGCLAHSPQVRDIFIGPLIEVAPNGFACDWHGNDLMWPQSGRVNEYFFGNTEFEGELRALLK